MTSRELSLSNQELSQPALTLARRFIQRWDIHALQQDNGRYICVHQPLNAGHLLAHLSGEITLGTYVLDRVSKARFLIFDADDDGGEERLAGLSETLAAEGITAYFEKSRRGGHLWMFFAEGAPGKEARAFGLGVLAAHHIEGVELFPKQDELGEGPGSLFRLPFGVHRLTGRRYGFFDCDGFPLAETLREQIEILGDPAFVSEAAFQAYQSYAPPVPERPVIEFRLPTGETVSERIKSSVGVLEFVSQYVDLKDTKTGAVGLCPFHDDQYPSLGVSSEGNFWHCFAGCGGGSVIDFWMKWRKCDFTTAVAELARMVL